LIGPWDSTAIGTNSLGGESPANFTSLLDAQFIAIVIIIIVSYQVHYITLNVK